MDEAAELSVASQAKLGRALETREVWPVGANGPDHRHLFEEVERDLMMVVENRFLSEPVERGH
jgi:transcriptional regulator with GAF, ATPase, and Fis domain